MRKSLRTVIEKLIEAEKTRCCPNCRSKGPFVVGIDYHKPENPEETFDSYLCDCGQRWTEGFRLIYSPKVDYKEFVGDSVVAKDVAKLIGFPNRI